MHIEYTISVGTIINLAVTMGAVLIGFWSIAGKLKVMEWKLGLIWKWYAKKHNMESGSGDLEKRKTDED